MSADTDAVDEAVERLRADIAGGGTAFVHRQLADLRTVLSELDRLRVENRQITTSLDPKTTSRISVLRKLLDENAHLRSAPPLPTSEKSICEKSAESLTPNCYRVHGTEALDDEGMCVGCGNCVESLAAPPLFTMQDVTLLEDVREAIEGEWPQGHDVYEKSQRCGDLSSRISDHIKGAADGR